MNRLALVMIVRDEARCLGRCLDSVRGVVGTMLVLDTGSRDATPAIAAAAGARVAHAAWGDDFAAARNTALALTEQHGDAAWHLILDADEWLVEGAATLAALGDTPADHIGQLCVDSSFDTAPGGAAARLHAPSWLPRLLPRGVRYAGRVHEQPVSALPRRRLAVRIGHDGYLDAQLGAKQGRNELLLRRALQAAPHDAYLAYQLGRDLQVQRRFADAAGPLRDACTLGAAGDPWRHDLVLRRVYTLKMAREFAQAVLFAEAEMPHWQHSPDFFFALGDLLLDWAASEPQRATELLPMIESSWLRALEIGEQPMLADSVPGRGSHLAAHNLAVFHQSLGDETQARFWHGRAAALRVN